MGLKSITNSDSNGVAPVRGRSHSDASGQWRAALDQIYGVQGRDHSTWVPAVLAPVFLSAALNVALWALLHRTRKEVWTDPLTGLPNRRHLTRRYRLEEAMSARLGRPFSVLMFDADRFKPVNDLFGHDEGDRAIRAIAALFLQTLRSGDYVARVGGDEFAVLLPGTDSNGATAVMEKILREINAGLREFAASRRVELDGYPDLSITAGQATHRSGAALTAADQALIGAKSRAANPDDPHPGTTAGHALRTTPLVDDPGKLDAATAMVPRRNRSRAR